MTTLQDLDSRVTKIENELSDSPVKAFLKSHSDSAMKNWLSNNAAISNQAVYASTQLLNINPSVLTLAIPDLISVGVGGITIAGKEISWKKMRGKEEVGATQPWTESQLKPVKDGLTTVKDKVTELRTRVIDVAADGAEFNAKVAEVNGKITLLEAKLDLRSKTSYVDAKIGTVRQEIEKINTEIHKLERKLA